jgi:hypothetical protein
MVFFVKQDRKSKTALLINSLLAICLSAAVSASNSGAHYPDCELQAVSDEHIILKYNPELSDDLSVIGRTSKYPVNGKTAWGRVILLAIPPGGNISYSVNFTRAGSASVSSTENYITAEMPLVTNGTSFDARGHRLVRLVIFPQRVEGGHLVIYKDFVIDIHLSQSNQMINLAPRLSRLDTVLAGSVINPDQFYRFGTAARQVAFRKSASPFDDAQQWVRIAVRENGVTRINGSALAQAGVDLSDLYSDSIRIFYAGGVNPPDSLLLPEPELQQISIKVIDGHDNRFNTGDYLLFYAEACDRYEFTGDSVRYIKNNYNDENYYWLAIGGHEGEVAERWTWQDGRVDDLPDRINVAYTRHPLRAEQENVIKVDGDRRIRNYYDWFWTNDPSKTISVNLPYLVAGDSMDIGLGAISSYNSTSMSLNGITLPKVKINNNYIRFWDVSGAAVDGINTLRIDMYHVSGQYLNYLDINYLRRLHYGGSQLLFNSQGYAGILRYAVTGASTSNYVLEISDPYRPVEVNGVQIMGDTARFQRPAAGQEALSYIMYSHGSAHQPVEVESVDPGSLRADFTQYDCITIAPQRFHSALEEYVGYRYETGGYRVKLVDVEDIYNGFGYGLMSPIAIRNYLRFVYANYDAPAPFAVLMVGDGHYDFLDNLGHHAPSYIPPFIWGREFSVGDDNYVYFGRYSWLDSDSSYIHQGDRGWDMMIARWPVRNTAEITEHIAALKNYESPETQGNWRTRVTYVADDEFKGPIANEIIHTAMAETLSVFYTPMEYVRNKIYATDYPFASNGEKPTVNDAIVKAINEGSLMVNYIGHGSPDVWADEHILKKSIDLSRLQNGDKLTTIIAGSCSIGFFDDPAKEGMAEIMFRQLGGALETVAATRLVYATDNAIFNYDLFNALFVNHCNISEAVYSAKVLHQYQNDYSLVKNDRSYVVFGDPLGSVALPEYQLVFNSGTDSLLTPLEYFGFSGSVYDGVGDPVTVDGMIEISVYDSPIMRSHELGIVYSLNGPSIFRGALEVRAGNFEGGFIVPLDIDYGGDAASLSGYGYFGGISGIGGMDSIAIAVTAGTTNDNTGPVIVFQIEEVPGFSSGDRVPSNASVVVELTDESGINVTGGLGHRIELVVDNDNNSTVNLTDLFSYLPGSYQTGDLQFTIPDLSPERHSFKIRAWDNANNPAMIEFEAIPSRIGRIALVDVMNYPNPMEDGTEFFFDLSESAEWVELQIFTLAGRMIRRFQAEDLPAGKNRLFFWDGRDFDGDRIAEGVYIYKITAKGRLAVHSRSADNMAEAFGKLILLN